MLEYAAHVKIHECTELIKRISMLSTQGGEALGLRSHVICLDVAASFECVRAYGY